MSGALSTIARPSEIKNLGASLQFFDVGWERIAQYFVHRAAVASLRELDDDALRDIGLVRSQIEAAVNGFITAPDQTRA